MARRGALLLVVMLLVGAGAALLRRAAPRDAGTSEAPLDARGPAAARDAVAGDPVRGLALLVDFRDSLPAHSGNGLRCTSCHLENGRRASSLPWLGTAERYPRYRARRGDEESLEQRVNECIARSLAGKPIPESGREMRDMVAYLETLGGEARPAAGDSVTTAGRVAAGERVYALSCARCHGTDGGGGIAPAVWGAGSYSVGAGMARQYTLAAFVWHNMPYDQPGTLSAQEAADVAAYILTQPRQDHPGKERDWPKGDPPPDVAYPTDAARAAGKPLPPVRPLLPRRLAPE